ncbi:ROK family protein [Halorussus amylolyticus]|uniref:ROK family protein n=1 Tax=Halorussus amylolyticus TaxID=1126242 RepID=UPI00104E977F|nr:ROK family protein [Halorussus amylolyticus]
MERIAVFGIGSTHCRYAVGTPSGEFLTDIEVEATDPADFEAQVLSAVRTLENAVSSPLAAVSISCTGLVGHSTGVVEELDTKDGDAVRDIDLRTAIRSEFDLPLFLENDCSASALGEWRFGVGETYDSVAHVTFGTGIGAGVVERGRLVRGESGHAAEVGLFPVAPTTGLDSFGVPGAWEAVCSGRGIPEYVAHRLRDEDRETALADIESLRAQDLFEAASDGDAVARGYLEDIGRYNAAGIGTLCNAYNPGVVTLGGGVALNNRQTVLEGIRAHLDDFCYVETPEVRMTGLGDEIGLYGALARGASESVSKAGETPSARS